MSEQDYTYIRERYGVPACYGRIVKFKGCEGIVINSMSQYIVVNFLDMRPGKAVPLHPTWEVEYLGMGKVRKPSRSQVRYQEYLDADWFSGSFAEWLGIEKERV